MNDAGILGDGVDRCRNCELPIYRHGPESICADWLNRQRMSTSGSPAESVCCASLATTGECAQDCEGTALAIEVASGSPEQGHEALPWFGGDTQLGWMYDVIKKHNYWAPDIPTPSVALALNEIQRELIRAVRDDTIGEAVALFRAKAEVSESLEHFGTGYYWRTAADALTALRTPTEDATHV